MIAYPLDSGPYLIKSVSKDSTVITSVSKDSTVVTSAIQGPPGSTGKVTIQALAIPTIASSATLTLTSDVVFVIGTGMISNIVALPLGNSEVKLIPKGLWQTNTVGNIALATTAIVNKVLTLTYDSVTQLWYSSY